MSSVGASDTRRLGFVLKIALFVTGCAGIIAEFVLSTLATYLTGNAVFQWTIVMSLMLFAMGLGSRFSRIFRENLLDTFIIVEFALSVLCAISSSLIYGFAAYTELTPLLIYFMALVIGMLIGCEIPLVTRINNDYEELRINISGVLEKDYYGALAGGMAFAFLALPKLGLTYTPIALGFLNFLVAGQILIFFGALLKRNKQLVLLGFTVLIFLITLAVLAQPIIMYGEQKKYRDLVIYSAQSPYQKIVMTRWKSYYWLFLNGQEQFSTFDEEKYHEPLVHPAMKLSPDNSRVLIIGGGDGLALREVLKYSTVRKVTLVDMDPTITNLAATHPILTQINRSAMTNPKVEIINTDGAKFIRKTEEFYGVIIVDLPDPDSVDLMHVYSKEFYAVLGRHLIRGGILTTQATSPYFSRKAFLCILKTVEAAGFSVLPYHNQIPTMGEWGWVLGVGNQEADFAELKQLAIKLDFSDMETRFISRDAMISMIHFGKGIFNESDMKEIQINTEINPVLYTYYADGTWGMY